MSQAFVAVGSNINPEENIPHALDLLARHVRICALSTFYRTPPLSAPQSETDTALQPDFYNGVVSVETNLTPLDLKWHVLRPIEDALGRLRGTDKFAPRPIDLDILLFDDLIVDNPDLTIPDPDIAHRYFLAVPLLELAPNLVLPGAHVLLSQMAKDISRATLHPLPAFTDRLRAQFRLMPASH